MARTNDLNRNSLKMAKKGAGTICTAPTINDVEADWSTYSPPDPATEYNRHFVDGRTALITACSGGCNPYNTSYQVGGPAITINPAAAAGGAVCGDPADTMEQTYLGLLPQAANFEISSGQLILRGNQGQEILRYTSTG